MRVRGRQAIAMIVALGAAVAVLVASPAASSATTTRGPLTGTPGAPGIGDSYFPRLGNGGYNVSDYHLDLRYNAVKKRIAGTATITAKATKDLSRFDFDLAGLTVSAISIDGLPVASWTRQGSELVITPATVLGQGNTFVTTVAYAGRPQLRSNKTLGDYGWFPSNTGVVMAGEPIAGQLWFPCNDHPADKATFSLTMTVPDAFSVVSNGVQTSAPVDDGLAATYTWASDHPMPTYAATVAIGKFRTHQYTDADGLPIFDAIEKGLPQHIDRTLHASAQIIDFFEQRFGPYPVEAAGGIVMRTTAGFALETQTRPVYTTGFFGGGDATPVVAHELAHMWYGDAVALHRWRDIWLNEGFATYLEWMWTAHHEHIPFDRLIRAEYSVPANDGFWNLKIGDPKPAKLFAWPVYARGALTLHALRQAVGDRHFFQIMRQWEHHRGGGNGTTAQFTHLAEQIAGRQLDGLFHRWLHTSDKPRLH